MQVVNLFANGWDEEADRPGHRLRRLRIGRRLGTERLGASLYELAPGEAGWPYHWHHANEEWLLVLAGTPTLRTPEGERQLEPGDLHVFPRGAEGAHALRNGGDDPARFVIVSTLLAPEVSEYPDSGKIRIGLWPDQSHNAVFRRDDAVDYWEGE